MSRTMKTGIAALAIVLVLAAAAVIGWSLMATPPAPTGKLEGSTIGGPFTLTVQEGRVITSNSFRGRYRLMYFGVTFCPDICTTDVQKMRQALRLFEQRGPARAARIQPMMVTIDPERDTLAVLKEFVSTFTLGSWGSPADRLRSPRHSRVSESMLANSNATAKAHI